ncbi:Mediator of RNA polymerase II transcription subunit 34 [Zea mays]|uniref:Mediator of RNA polymerase II transcription subunit 34 n=1 Tax=Zea mays TaxID=4577 RepID=A0A1D6KC83_MAIZE|nr:Mediator of RNA polymerase II transcription subunit 34 [Zea mays]
MPSCRSSFSDCNRCRRLTAVANGVMIFVLTTRILAF